MGVGRAGAGIAALVIGAALASLAAAAASASWSDAVHLRLALGTRPLPAPVPLSDGLTVWWFANPLQGDGLCSSDPANWVLGAPIGRTTSPSPRVEVGLGVSPAPGLPSDCVGARFIGYLQAPAGRWRFATSSDDAAAIYLGGRLSADGMSLPGAPAISLCWQKACGWHESAAMNLDDAGIPGLPGMSAPIPFAVDWYDWGGPGMLAVYVRPEPDDGFGWRQLPASWFRTFAAGPGW